MLFIAVTPVIESYQSFFNIGHSQPYLWLSNEFSIFLPNWRCRNWILVQSDRTFIINLKSRNVSRNTWDPCSSESWLKDFNQLIPVWISGTILLNRKRWAQRQPGRLLTITLGGSTEFKGLGHVESIAGFSKVGGESRRMDWQIAHTQYDTLSQSSKGGVMKSSSITPFVPSFTMRRRENARRKDIFSG